MIPCISASGTFLNVSLKLALVGVFCDLPASRKVCGFTSFNSLHGCNKCLKCFPVETFGEKPDYSGFNRSEWPLRNLDIHKMKCMEHLSAVTKSYQKSIEKNYGLRYSVLIELPYFNPIRHTVIDPMHNLFLGTAKYCMEFWTKNNILSKQDLDLMEERMSHLLAPHSVGRLPLKISSGFSGFSADQWRNWTVCYSPIALRGVLPSNHLQYWLLFVKATSLLCSQYLKKSNIELADQYLNMFCSKFEAVNGKAACTPNMHLHMHLKKCIHDYGPLYSFGCYAFERYNGMLGSFPTNQKNIEPQLMKKCLMLQELYSQSFPPDGQAIEGILRKYLPLASGGLRTTMSGEEMIKFANLSTPLLSQVLDFKVSGYIKLLPPVKQFVLDGNMLSYLQNTYELLYPGTTLNTLQQFAKQSPRSSFLEEVYGSTLVRRESNIVVMAYWPSCSATLPQEDRYLPLSIGQTQFFLKHNLGGNEHIFAFVHWFRKHQNHDWFGSCATVCQPEFETDLSYSFIPLQRIVSLCVYGQCTISFANNVAETVLIATPTTIKHLHF